MKNRATKSAVYYDKGDMNHKAKCLRESDSNYFTLLTYALWDSSHKFYAIIVSGFVLLFNLESWEVGGGTGRVGQSRGPMLTHPLTALNYINFLLIKRKSSQPWFLNPPPLTYVARLSFWGKSLAGIFTLQVWLVMIDKDIPYPADKEWIGAGAVWPSVRLWKPTSLNTETSEGFV